MEKGQNCSRTIGFGRKMSSIHLLSQNDPAVFFWPQNALKTKGQFKTKPEKTKTTPDLLNLAKNALR